MAFLKFRLKDMIIVSLCTTLILLPYFLLMHTPTAMLIQAALSHRLSDFMGSTNETVEINSTLPIEPIEPIEPQKTNFNVSSPLQIPNISLSAYAPSVSEEIPGLDDILSRAAMPSKTLIITTLNSAWAEEDSMIDLFLGSFHAGEGISHYLDHLLIVALDQPSYDRCLAIHQHCFRLETEGVDFAAEKFFMSADYLKMMWRRVEFLRIVLELGYNLLFSDADIMWFRDPFPQFSADADFQIACDHFNGIPTDLSNFPNGGFLFVKSNERTIAFYKYWYEARLKHPNQHDQDVFNYIKYTKQFAAYQLKLEFLQTVYFGGFCEVSRDFEKVCTMHANCCTGLERKLFDLRLTLADWTQYKSMTPQQRNEQRIFWQAPKECLHSW